VIEGRLELVFAVRGERTVLAHARASAPLKIVRPFFLEDGRALVQILTLGPGLCAGDMCSVDVTVEPGARAIVITQAASRILGMTEEQQAAQRVTLRVRADAQLEYFPGLTIPFPGSSFVQHVEVDAQAGARVGVVETWAMGRSGCGEYLQFRRVRSETTLTVDGVPLYADVIDLEPAAVNVAGTGILDGRRYLASGFWYGATLPATLPVPPQDMLVAIGQTAPDQVYLRALADDGFGLGETLQAIIRSVHAGWRLRPIPIRRFTS